MNASVENIPVGVCLFDGDLSLVAFNSEYAKLLDIPRSLLESGATFQDLVRFNAERGEYGGRPIDKEIESRTQMLLTSLEGRVERVRPNGTVLENRNRTLPSGGHVIVYTDLTDTQPIEPALRQSKPRYPLAPHPPHHDIADWGDAEDGAHSPH